MGACSTPKSKSLKKIEEPQTNEFFYNSMPTAPNRKSITSPNRKSITSPKKIRASLTTSPKKSPKKNQSIIKRSDTIGDKLFDLPLDLQYIEDNIRDYYENFKVISEKNEGKIKILKVNSINTKKLYQIIQLESDRSNETTQELNSIKLILNMDHFNIIKCKKSIISFGKKFLITEHSTKGYLNNHLELMNELESGMIIYQILKGIAHMNNNKIMHRNIKPDNILITDFLISEKYYYVKLSNFRKGDIYKEDELKFEMTGSPYYIAPEVIEKNYNEKCDIWSVGVIFYQLLHGYPPFVGEYPEKTLEKIKASELVIDSKLSNNCILLIKQLLNKDYKNRISVHDALGHNFFKTLKIHEKFAISQEKLIEILTRISNNFLGFQINVIIEFLSDINMNNEEFEIQCAFEMLDKDQQGKISKSEIYKCLSENEGKDIQKIQNIENFFGKRETINYFDFLLATFDKNLILVNIETFYNFIKNKFSGIKLGIIAKLFKYDMTGEINSIILRRKINCDPNIELDDLYHIMNDLFD